MYYKTLITLHFSFNILIIAPLSLGFWSNHGHVPAHDWQPQSDHAYYGRSCSRTKPVARLSHVLSARGRLPRTKPVAQAV